MTSPQPEPIGPNASVISPGTLTSLVEALSLGATTTNLFGILGALPGVLPNAARALLDRLPERAGLQRGDAVLSPVSVRATQRLNTIRRAQFLANAARRVSEADDLEQAVQREVQRFHYHQRASENRQMAATKVAQAQDRFGGTVGWYAKMDSRTSAECRKANGTNFRADQIPAIGYPGSVHPHCRCRPGPPHQHGDGPGGVRIGQKESTVTSVNKYPKDIQLVELAKSSGSLRRVATHLGVSRVSLTNYLLRRPALDTAVRSVLSSRAHTREQVKADLRLASSKTYPKLERVPGKQNWVDKSGGLPAYIERIAKHLHYEKGMDISRAIAVAVNTVKRWAAGGTVTSGGTTKTITAKTQAQAAAAVAEWEAKKASSHSHASPARDAVELATYSTQQLGSYYGQQPPTKKAPAKKGGGPAAPPSGKKKVVRTSAGAARYKVPVGSEIGSARDANAAKAQQNTAAVTKYKGVVGAKDRDNQVKALNNDELGQLSQVAFSFKTSNPDVVALRNSVISQMRSRGMDPAKFGYLGGGGGTKPVAKAPVKKALPVKKVAPRIAPKAVVRKPVPAPVKKAPGSLKMK